MNEELNALKQLVKLVLDEERKEKEKEPERLISIDQFCKITGASRDYIREKCWCTDKKLHPFPCLKREGKTGKTQIRLYLSKGQQWLDDEMTGAWKKRA